ncbi:FAD-binding monooxygenase [Ktedonospora formicarum]|uniref:FAD-binding monooxygenase n=1 Tax=Ktedonospora formicarum TaxID=2778364 RepID=A0A8J3I9B6_9CHLR|nr:FAD-binding monooxygenase [Ktedonospora formicarum]
MRAAGAELADTFGFHQGQSLREVIESRPRKPDGEKKLPGGGMLAKISPSTAARGTQDKIEPVLLQAARERGGDLRFFTELRTFEQDDTGVTATVRERKSGAEYTVHADYMIAADGANSRTRSILGATTSGRGSLGHLLNVLFQADLRELVRGRKFSLCIIDRPEVRGLFTSINNSDRWVFHISYDYAKGERAEDYPLERCEKLLRLALGMPEIKLEIKSILPWESAMRVVDNFQHGHVFFAGDAAHQMPPWGGQGANTGIADAHNLAWKLAAVLKRQAGPTLLNTYDVERRPVGYLAADESAAAADARGLLSKSKMTALLPMIRRAPRLLGYGYEYASKAVISDGTTARGIVWQLLSGKLGLDGRPGTRAPHAWIEYEGKRISTLDLFGKGFVLLTGTDGNAWYQAAPLVAQRLGIDLCAYRINPAGDLRDPDDHWRNKAGISTQGALLVRPDGFVAWRSRQQHSHPRQELERTITHILSRDTIYV